MERSLNILRHFFPSLVCLPPDFLCNNGACLDSVKVCNGIMDCSNGEDEKNEKCNSKLRIFLTYCASA